jgi:hypothetical protein
MAGRAPDACAGTADQLLELLGDQNAAAKAADPQAGTRGFALVSRMVGSYRGHISVRTGDLVADLVFGIDRDGAGQVNGGFGCMPGTLLEAVVLTGSPLSSPSGRWEEHPAVHRDHTLHWIACDLDTRYGLGRADLDRLRAMTALSGPEHTAVGTVVTVSTREALKHAGSISTQQALRLALCAISGAIGTTATAVVFPDADRHLLDLCISSLTCEDEQGVLRCTDQPILVCGMSGEPLWCGGGVALRAVLRELTAAGGVLAIDRARACWRAAGGAGRLETAVRATGHLVSPESDRLVLCLSPRQAMRALSAAVRRELMAEIDADGSGVLRGRFRIPSLHVTDRWIDTDRLVSGTVGFDVAAFVLARAVEAALSASAAPLVVAQAASCPPQLATRLSECLSLGGRSYPMAFELDRDGWPTSGEVPDGAWVVLCADLICTENTVRRAAAAIVRNAKPAAIVCIVDGRRDRGPIKVLNWGIPVIALSETVLEDVAEPTDASGRPIPIVDIDPISRRPVEPRRAEPQLLTEDEILDWCVASRGTLRLGHIERHPRIHFSAYLQVDRMLRQPEVEARITDVYLEAIGEALGVLDAGSSPGGPAIEVWHPGDADDYGGRLTKAVHARLCAHGYPAGRLVSVQRIVAGNRWQTAPVARPDETRARTVVIVDWGALTTTTLDQMIRRAADSGARTIIAVVLLNQLPAHDPGLLSSISAVHANGPGGPVPVAIRFIAESSIGELPVHDCPMCATRTKYGEVADLPDRLRRHVQQLQGLLRTRNRGEVFQTAPADVFSVPVDDEDVADYLRWRGLLQRAQRDTGARQEVVDRLRLLASGRRLPGWRQSSLIRLLAAEQQWLKLPPLRYEVSWDPLAEICVAELRTPAASPPWFRVQVVMVLSAAAPGRFATLLPNLLNLMIDEPVAVDQMCVDCYRLLRRPAYDSPIDLALLRDRLQRCRDDLEQLPGSEDHELIDGHVQLFRGLIYVAEHPGLPRGGGAQAAWAGLREDLCRPVIRHRFEAGVLCVRDFLEDLQEARPSTKQRRSALSDWERCAHQLEELALAHLPGLAGILTGDYAADQLGRELQARLVELATSDLSVTSLHATTDWFFDLLHRRWNPGDPAWQELRGRLLDEVNWWFRSFLATHRPGTELPAYVVQFVHSAPVLLGDVVSGTVLAQSHGLELAACREPRPGTQVFCPAGLLEEAVRHALDNVRRHRLPDAVPRLHVGYLRPEPNTIIVSLRNSGTRPSAVSGHGLRSLAGRLAPFGGHVAGRTLTGEEWTYQTEITLQLWRGV